MHFRNFIMAMLFCIVSNQAVAMVTDTLYINRDTLNLGSFLTHFAVFNSEDSFTPANSIIRAEVNELIETTIINSDTLQHTFTIDGVTTTGIINPGDTATVSYSLSNEGTYRFYSDVSYGYLLSASSQIFITDRTNETFFWNLFDQSNSLSEDIALLNVSSAPSNYFSNIYTINNRIYPDIQNDTTAIVTGNVGDTILISVLNSGKMAHSLHFHGYHVKIINYSKNPSWIGRIKDSVPIDAYESCTLELVPHQPGMFPVHDHNLFAVNTGGYPGGMITTLIISP